MNRTKIEWIRNPDGSQGFTWNPATGCLHGCSYCYARRIAKRFSPKRAVHESDCWTIGKHCFESVSKKPFPRGFTPTIYPARIREPLRRKKPATIFVCSMADLFGKWVPASWIEAVLETVRSCPQHTFIFLTKNPNGYRNLPRPENALFGASATNQKQWNAAFLQSSDGPLAIVDFISAEPLLDSIEPYGIEQLKWLIIGANSNRGAKRPNPEWGLNLVHAAIQSRVPVFMKNNWPWCFPIGPCEAAWPQEFLKGIR